MKRAILFICILLLITANVFSKEGESTKLTGPYLGQKPPGMEPEMFAPGIVSHPDYFEHSAAVFSPDLSEVFWSAKLNGERYLKIYFMKMVNGVWSERQVAPFCLGSGNYDDPVFSIDGKMLFFDNNDDIWFVERKGDGWSKPSLVTTLINSPGIEQMEAITRDGSIYFSRFNPQPNNYGTRNETYVSRMVNGIYEKPEKLDKTINSDDADEMTIFVDPDERYMIIEASKDRSICELFISNKNNDNSWSERIKLPLGWARFPSMSPDGKYLFFMTRDGIYWVSAKVVEDLRVKK
jgi:Tol biopolymer transport system component